MTQTNDNSALVAAALAATDPGLAVSVDATESWVADLKQQGARVSLYRQYEEGEHRSGITDQMRKMLRLPEDDSGITDFNDNYCRIIVSKMASRLQVSGITTGDDAVDKNWLGPILEHNDWQALQGTVFQGAIRDGDAYVLIDAATLLWASEPMYDGFSGIVLLIATDGRTPIWGCKLWSESVEAAETGSDESSVTMRIVVYQPTRISYWWGKAGSKEIHPDNRVAVQSTVDQENGFSEIQESMTNSTPWPAGRIPIIHFANQYTNFGSWGRSEVRPAIPLQDVLNRTLHSMTMASEFSAFLVKWSKGIEIDASGITPGAVINLLLKDANGNIVTEMSPELVAFLNAVEVGQFEATDLAQYISQIDKLARELSQISETPIYGVTTEGVLSGEALRQLEIGLIGKVVRFQHDNTDAVRQLLRVTALLQNTFQGDTTLPEPPASFKSIAPSWKSAELLDVNAQIAALVAMRKDAPGLWDDDFYRSRIGELLQMRQAEIDAETLKAKQGQSDTFDLLTGGLGTTLPVSA